jgi:SAM-dependent methyltransferase
MTTSAYLEALNRELDRYAGVRVDYDDSAIQWMLDELRIGPGTKVLDVLAAPGRLTRRLVKANAEVMALEVSADAVDYWRRVGDGVTVVEGSAEAIPLPDSSTDAVTVAQAFHWLDADKALEEFHRILRPGGGLGVTYTWRDPRDEAQAEFSEIITPLAGEFTWREGAWRGAIAGSPLFSPGSQRSVPIEQVLDEAGLVAHFNSIGFVASSSPAQRDPIEQEVRRLAQRLGGRVVLRYENVVIACVRC